MTTEPWKKEPPSTEGFSEDEVRKAKATGEIQINVEKAERHRRMIKGLEGSLHIKQEPGQQPIADRIRGNLEQLERLERLIAIGLGYVERK